MAEVTYVIVDDPKNLEDFYGAAAAARKAGLVHGMADTRMLGGCKILHGGPLVPNAQPEHVGGFMPELRDKMIAFFTEQAISGKYRGFIIATRTPDAPHILAFLDQLRAFEPHLPNGFKINPQIFPLNTPAAE